MKEIKDLRVLYHDRPVGRLALYKGRLAAFEYDQQWIRDCVHDHLDRYLRPENI